MTKTKLLPKYQPGDSSVFYLANSDFKIQKADLSIVNLVPEVVTSLNFSQGTNLIQTSVTLIKNDNQLTGIGSMPSEIKHSKEAVNHAIPSK